MNVSEWILSDKKHGNHYLWEMSCEDCGATIYDRPGRIKKGLRKTNLCKSCRGKKFMKENDLHNKNAEILIFRAEKVLRQYALGNIDMGETARKYFKDNKRK